MIHRIVLFLKFAPSSEDFNRTFMDIDSIVPLWILIQSYLYGIERNIELPLTVRLPRSLRI